MKPAGLLIASAVLANGCYLVHERDDADAGLIDARGTLPDVVFPDVVEPDAATTCTAHCSIADDLGALGLPSLDTQGSYLENVLADDALFGIVLGTFPDSPTEAELQSEVFRLDLVSGELRWLPLPSMLDTHSALRGASLRVLGDQLELVLLRTNALPGMDADASVGRAVWSLATLELTSVEPTMATAPFRLSPSPEGQAVVFGRDGRDLAAFASGASVFVFVVDRSAGTSTLPLVSLTDDGALEPLSGTTLDDGRVVLVGGGVADLRATSRAPFMALGRIEDGPLPAMPVIGALHDATPVVARDGAGFLLVRHVTNDSDVLRSSLRLQHRASDGSLLSESHVPTVNGRRPLWTAAMDGARAALAWVEHSETSSTSADVRVLGPGIGATCESIAVEPSATVAVDITGFDAVAAADGTVYFVTLTRRPGPLGSEVRIHRVGDCSLRR